MDITFRVGSPIDQKAGALLVPVAGGEIDGAASPLLRELDARLSGHVSALAGDAGFSGKAGATLTVPTLGHLPATRLILIGIGAEERLTAASLTRSYGAAALAARDAGARTLAVALPAESAAPRIAAIEAAALGL
ncbi:MAG TPA: M17 family peptidase N-terminal domain-containing protein, partial [Thermomicrobiales bacterium]|nr:M17 family peptidase N-terminal domain-containing protein [Thermomicrobiales bacterium]